MLHIMAITITSLLEWSPELLSGFFVVLAATTTDELFASDQVCVDVHIDVHTTMG